MWGAVRRRVTGPGFGLHGSGNHCRLVNSRSQHLADAPLLPPPPPHTRDTNRSDPGGSSFGLCGSWSGCIPLWPMHRIGQRQPIRAPSHLHLLRLGRLQGGLKVEPNDGPGRTITSSVQSLRRSQGHHGLPLHRRRATSGSGSLLNSALASSQGHERYERRDGALFFEVRPVWPVGRS